MNAGRIEPRQVLTAWIADMQRATQREPEACDLVALTLGFAAAIIAAGYDQGTADAVRTVRAFGPPLRPWWALVHQLCIELCDDYSTVRTWNPITAGAVVTYVGDFLDWVRAEHPDMLEGVSDGIESIDALYLNGPLAGRLQGGA